MEYIPIRISSTRLFNHWYIYHSELKQNTFIKWYIYHFYSRCKNVVYILFRISATYRFIHWYIYHSGISIMSSQGGIHTTDRLNQKVVYIQLRILRTCQSFTGTYTTGLSMSFKKSIYTISTITDPQFSHWYIYQSELKQNIHKVVYMPLLQSMQKCYIYHFGYHQPIRSFTAIYTILGFSIQCLKSSIYTTARFNRKVIC